MTGGSQGIGRKMAKGAIWMVMFKLIQRVIGFASTLILARLLVPADFGLIAMAMSIFAILEIMSAFSFDLALIQNQHAERRHYDTVWTFNVLFGLLNAMLMIVLAVPAAAFFSEPRVEWIMYSLALCALLSGFDNIGVVAFQKDLELHKDFYFGVAKKLTTFVVTVGLAYLWRDYWALIAGMVTGRVVGLCMSYWVHPYRPRFSLAAASELFHFSKWMLINNILIYINNSGINSVIGKVFGAPVLGIYTVAYEISNLPTTELVWPISRAVFPGYSMLAGDIAELRKSFLQVISVITLLTVPAGIGIGLIAESLVRVLLGEKWMDAVPLIQVLAVFGVVRTLLGPPGSIYVAVGKPQLVAYLQMLHIAVAVLMLFWLMDVYGVVGVPWAILIASAVSMPTSYIWLMRELKLSFSSLVSVLWRPLAAAGFMCIPVLGLQQWWLIPNGVGHNIVRLFVLVVAGACTYSVVLLALWRLGGCPAGAETTIANLIKSKVFSKG